MTDKPETTEKAGNAIACHVAMIATYLREMDVSADRQKQIARNVGDAVLLALRKMP